MGEQDKNKGDWVERVVAISKLLGMNPVKVRWKLLRFQKKRADDKQRAERRAEQVGYKHRICQHCGVLQDRHEKVCSACDRKLGLRQFEVLRRMGIDVAGVSAGLWLAIGMMMVYGVLAYESPDHGILSMDIRVLWAHGASYPRLVSDSEWWRLLAAQFLHIGLWHLGFNIVGALSVGSHAEALYGRGVSILLFVCTGALAALVSSQMNFAVSAGASGALMGWVGLVATRAHLDGKHHRARRNQALKWFVYTMLFGAFIGADNWAHAGGFASGCLLALVVPTSRKRGEFLIWRVAAWVGVLLACLSIVLAGYPRGKVKALSEEEQVIQEINRQIEREGPIELRLAP